MANNTNMIDWLSEPFSDYNVAEVLLVKDIFAPSTDISAPTVGPTAQTNQTQTHIEFQNATEVGEIFMKRNLLSCQCPEDTFLGMHGDAIVYGDPILECKALRYLTNGFLVCYIRIFFKT